MRPVKETSSSDGATVFDGKVLTVEPAGKRNGEGERSRLVARALESGRVLWRSTSVAGVLAVDGLSGNGGYAASDDGNWVVNLDTGELSRPLGDESWSSGQLTPTRVVLVFDRVQRRSG